MRYLVTLVLCGAALVAFLVFGYLVLSFLGEQASAPDPARAGYVYGRPEDNSEHSRAPATPPARAQEAQGRAKGSAADEEGGALGEVVALALLLVAFTWLWLRLRPEEDYVRLRLKAPAITTTTSPWAVAALMQGYHQLLVSGTARNRLRFRARRMAFEIASWPTPEGGLVAITVLCPESLAVAFDTRLAGTYRDARLGYSFGGPPNSDRLATRALNAAERWGSYLVRMRRRRDLFRRLGTAQLRYEESVMATLERSLGRLDRPCLVQFALRPRTRFSEFCLRLAYYVRERNAGPFDSILSSGGDSTLAAEERVGGLVSQRSRLWRLDVRVLGEEEKNVEEVAAVLAAASGDDQLVPRRSSRRATRRYANRVRFADFGGFLPDLTQGTISSEELAHLVHIPSLEQGGGGLARHRIPRVPATRDVPLAAALEHVRAQDATLPDEELLRVELPRSIDRPDEAEAPQAPPASAEPTKVLP